MEKGILEKYVNEKLSIRQIAGVTNRSVGSVRYWLAKHNLKTKHVPTTSVLANKEMLSEAIANTDSISDALHYLGERRDGGMHRYFHKWCEIHGLTPKRGKAVSGRKYTMEDILVEGSTYSRASLKSRLIAENLLEYRCSDCGNTGEWNGKELTLQISHKNGVNNDNRLNNLEFLCPNCHSQTDDYAGKSNKGKTRTWYGDKPELKCTDCMVTISTGSKRCRTCANKLRASKIKWPELENLLAKLYSTPITKVAKELGVSDTAVRKHLIKHGVDPKEYSFYRKVDKD